MYQKVPNNVNKHKNRFAKLCKNGRIVPTTKSGNDCFHVIYLFGKLIRALSSYGRAPVLHSGGERFYSARVHKAVNIDFVKFDKNI